MLGEGELVLLDDQPGQRSFQRGGSRQGGEMEEKAHLHQDSLRINHHTIDLTALPLPAALRGALPLLLPLLPSNSSSESSTILLLTPQPLHERPLK